MRGRARWRRNILVGRLHANLDTFANRAGLLELRHATYAFRQ